MQRREFLTKIMPLGIGALAMPKLAFANAPSDTRFIFIIQRGAADGLETLIPYGDVNYLNLRKNLAVENGYKLDSMFALHPSLRNLHELYNNKQASFVHAISSPYRERSHFDGQNILEGGFLRPYQNSDGWLNRFLSILPNNDTKPIAFSPTIPLAMRGANQVNSYFPNQLPDANNDLFDRISSLYQNDSKLYDLWLKADETRQIAQSNKAGNPSEIAKLIANFMNKPDGARIAMYETTGWDTHTAQTSRLKNGLGALDDLIGNIRTEFGHNWNKTIILIATEFGRTAAINGTNGTDHGTGACAIIAGGAFMGGKIIADWPGLAPNNLYQNRDLMPTNNIFALIASLLSQGFAIDIAKIQKQVFTETPFGKSIQI
jgi:uncharacterized protein (DUF1501 family)